MGMGSQPVSNPVTQKSTVSLGLNLGTGWLRGQLQRWSCPLGLGVWPPPGVLGICVPLLHQGSKSQLQAPAQRPPTSLAETRGTLNSVTPHQGLTHRTGDSTHAPGKACASSEQKQMLGGSGRLRGSQYSLMSTLTARKGSSTQTGPGCSVGRTQLWTLGLSCPSAWDAAKGLCHCLSRVVTGAKHSAVLWDSDLPAAPGPECRLVLLPVPQSICTAELSAGGPPSCP